MVALRMAALSTASSIGAPSRNDEAMASSTSAAASISFSRAAATSSAIAAGIVVLARPLFLVAREIQRPLPHQIDEAREPILGADRQLDRHRLARRAARGSPSTAAAKSAPARSILLMKRDARDAELVGLTPDRLRLRLDARHAVEHHHRAVEHAQAALDLDGEVDVAGGVDEVDVVVAPGEAGGGGGDGDAALALLRHPVHRRLPLVDLADLVDASRVEEEALADRRLAGVDVRDDADVADARHLRGGGFAGGGPSAATQYTREIAGVHM